MSVELQFDRRSSPEVRALHQQQSAAFSADRFEAGLVELSRFVAAYGHARVPARYETDQGVIASGSGAGGCAESKRRGSCRPTGSRSSIGFGFPWHPHDAAFERGLAEFVASSRSGPPPSMTASGFNLARWIRIVRDLRSAGELGVDRIEALDGAGFRWDEPNPDAERFAEGLAALDGLIASGSEPGCRASSSPPMASGSAAGCATSVVPYVGAAAKQQRTALRSRGVTVSYDADRVAYGLRSFVRFREAHPGRVPSSIRRDGDGFGLGMWFTVRRREARAGRLDARIARQFAAMGVEFHAFPRPMVETHEHQFATALAAYRAYAERTGRRYPHRGERMADGRDLSVWVMNLRISWRLGRLPLDRIRAAEEAGLIFPESEQLDRDSAFTAGVVALREFVGANGHDRVPRDVRMADGRLLAIWVARMRRQDRAGALTAEQRATLVDTGLSTGRYRGRPAASSSVDHDHLGVRLHAFRVASEMPLDDLAITLGVSAATIRSIERNRPRGPVKLALVGRIADLIGIDRPTAARLAGWPPDDVAAVFGVSA